MLEDLHEWLFGATKNGPVTVREMMHELSLCRNGGHSLSTLPMDGMPMQQAMV